MMDITFFNIAEPEIFNDDVIVALWDDNGC